MAGINLRLQVDGIDDLMHRLSRVLAAETRAAPMERLRKRLAERLQTYPPPTGGDYVRTGDLGRGWAQEGSVEVDATGTNQFADRVSVELKNTVEYAPWVQDPEQQAGVHRGRWTTTQAALDAETGPFMSDLTDSLDGALGGG
jgi:hypothetical protein